MIQKPLWTAIATGVVNIDRHWRALARSCTYLHCTIPYMYSVCFASYTRARMHVIDLEPGAM